MKIRELLTDESKWTKGAAARDASGEPVLCNDPSAVAWSLDGALEALYGDWIDLFSPAKPIRYAILRHAGLKEGSDHVSEWNDHKKRKFSEVKALIEEMDI